MDFAVVFEKELRMDLAEFLEYSEHATFREKVQQHAKRFGEAEVVFCEVPKLRLAKNKG